jgi:hypothetical protein
MAVIFLMVLMVIIMGVILLMDIGGYYNGGYSINGY